MSFCFYSVRDIMNHAFTLTCVLVGAWIVTGGTHAGVMKYVGEAVRNHTIAHGNSKPIATIGIAPWGCISNRDVLDKNKVCMSSVTFDVLSAMRNARKCCM